MSELSDDDRLWLAGVESSPAARAILRVAVEHSLATSTTEEAEDGHNGFLPQFTDPDGPSLRCGVCGARLPLE